MEPWTSLGRFTDAELLVVKSLLEGADIPYLENLQDDAQVMRLYTAGTGGLGTELLVAPGDLGRATELLKEE